MEVEDKWQLLIGCGGDRGPVYPGGDAGFWGDDDVFGGDSGSRVEAWWHPLGALSLDCPI